MALAGDDSTDEALLAHAVILLVPADSRHQHRRTTERPLSDADTPCDYMYSPEFRLRLYLLQSFQCRSVHYGCCRFAFTGKDLLGCYIYLYCLFIVNLVLTER